MCRVYDLAIWYFYKKKNKYYHFLFTRVILYQKNYVVPKSATPYDFESATSDGVEEIGLVINL